METNLTFPAPPQKLPKGVSASALRTLLEDSRQREKVLKTMIARFEAQYGESLDELESRLAVGRGSEHPDWEHSIEWRNAEEALQREQLTRRLLEWLLPLIAPSTAS